MAPDNNGQGERQGEGNDRPYLFVHSYPPPIAHAPAFPTDTGKRPVPTEVVWYLCSGIQPLTVFQPGTDLTVTVTIGNWQGGNSDSIAYVGLWWTLPVSGSPMPGPDKFIGFTTVVVPPHGGQVVSDPLTAKIPEDSGDHICLLAKVWHPLDLPDAAVADPVNDRHWAQHNLVILPSEARQTFTFLATNPTDREAGYQINVRPVHARMWPNFNFDGNLQPVRATARRLVLTSEVGEQEVQGEGTLIHTLVLDPEEQRELKLTIDLSEPLRQGTFAPFEIVQSIEERPTGGIGIAVVGSS
ncbi:hypothetical protein [Streptomyces sp. Ag109_G2-15]|uniref:hypothetical protein n=1 Tax=Streptomyces sp. Ag109_G2-15 TaxID=1938850 RepID=UPI000BDBF9A6|nr:hypothetical protein [Streptomyces sp. Ag109_G2-15]SOD88017.1 hypothetical protein SAMN06272765_5502 [Streptomyces sp. Ag109_G2-15]